jgi:hypothetical protein
MRPAFFANLSRLSMTLIIAPYETNGGFQVDGCWLRTTAGKPPFIINL